MLGKTGNRIATLCQGVLEEYVPLLSPWKPMAILPDTWKETVANLTSIFTIAAQFLQKGPVLKPCANYESRSPDESWDESPQ